MIIELYRITDIQCQMYYGWRLPDCMLCFVYGSECDANHVFNGDPIVEFAIHFEMTPDTAIKFQKLIELIFS